MLRPGLSRPMHRCLVEEYTLTLMHFGAGRELRLAVAGLPSPSRTRSADFLQEFRRLTFSPVGDAHVRASPTKWSLQRRMQRRFCHPA